MKKRLIKKLKGPSATFKIFEIKIGNEKLINNVVEFPETVAVLPIISKKKILLLRQYRFPIGKEIWEIPAGKLEKGEKPEIGAKRELREEKMHLFFAEKLKKKKQALEKGEMIKEVKIFDEKEALKMIKEGKIKDVKTQIAIFLKVFLNLT